MYEKLERSGNSDEHLWNTKNMIILISIHFFSYDTPFPHVQEQLYLPSKWKIIQEIKRQMEEAS